MLSTRPESLPQRDIQNSQDYDELMFITDDERVSFLPGKLSNEFPGLSNCNEAIVRLASYALKPSREMGNSLYIHYYR